MDRQSGQESVKVYYDPEGDFMEVTFERKPGFFRETKDDRFMEKVDSEGRVLGFSVLGVSSLKGNPPAEPFEFAIA